MELTAHAYVVRGGPEAIAGVNTLLKKNGIAVVGNPDVLIREYSNFSMEDARALSERSQMRAMSAQGRVFVISAPTIPVDAQNALLKTFEEPPAGARFFLIVPSPGMLLPTLRSRMQTLEVAAGDSGGIIDAQQFLKAVPEKRVEMLKPLLEKGEDDKRDLSGTITFLADIEQALAVKPRENAAGLRAIYRARKYITDRGALAKTLLEQTALIIQK